jgi:hypothetical protein
VFALSSSFGSTLTEGLGLVVAFAVVGLVQFAATWFLDDVCTPGHLRGVISEQRSWNAALYAAASLLSTGLIVFVAVINTEASVEGLLLATAWALAANVVKALGLFSVRWLFRVDMAKVLAERSVSPEGLVIAASNLGLGLIVAAAAS